MNHAGPPIELLTHRLAECPSDFLETPRRGKSGVIDVAAIVCDQFRQMGAEVPEGIAGSIHRFSAYRIWTIFNLLEFSCLINWVNHSIWKIHATYRVLPHE